MKLFFCEKCNGIGHTCFGHINNTVSRQFCAWCRGLGIVVADTIQKAKEIIQNTPYKYDR
jgi:hypothetical protein